MAGQHRQISLRSQLGWLLPAGAMVLALVFSALNGSSGHAFLTDVALSTAVLLLLGVVRASLRMGHAWRVFARHDSIRTEIAAAGGLGERLAV